MENSKTILVLVAIVAVASAGLTYTFATDSNGAKNLDKALVLGHVELVVYDEAGNIKQYTQTDNAIVNNGLDVIAGQLFGNNTSGLDITSSETIKFMSIGTGESDDTVVQTETELLSGLAACGNQTTPWTESEDTSNDYVRMFTNSTFTGSGTCTGTINEAGLYTDDDTTGVLFAKQAFNSNSVTLGTQDTLQVNWDIKFCNSNCT